MHNRLLVLFPKEQAQNSIQARRIVLEELSNAPGFIDESHAVADWFVVGGRWSGTLTAERLNQKRLRAYRKDFKKKYGWWTNAKVDERTRRKQGQKLFKKYFPEFKGTYPDWRDTYLVLGYPDDAQILDRRLYCLLLKEYENAPGAQKGIIDGGGDPEVIDLDARPLTKNLIAESWLVVVDYHY